MTAAALAGLVALAGMLATRALVRAGRRAEVTGRLRPDRAPALPPPPARLARALADADAPPWAWSAWVAAVAAVVPLALLLGGPGLGLVAGAAAIGGPALALAAAHDRAARRHEAELPAHLDAVARSLRSGAVLRDALHEAGGELAAVAREAGDGVPLVHALDRWAERHPASRATRLAVAALALAADAGGAAARAVDGVADTLRADLAVAAEVRAQSSQARYSALVIALAPLGFGLLAAGTDGRTADFLLRTPVGLACLAVGLGLDGVGAWWMHRITRAAA